MPTTEYEYDNGTNMSDLGERWKKEEWGEGVFKWI